MSESTSACLGVSDSWFLPLSQALEGWKEERGRLSWGLVHTSLTGCKCDSAFNLILNVVPIPYMSSSFLSSLKSLKSKDPSRL